MIASLVLDAPKLHFMRPPFSKHSSVSIGVCVAVRECIDIICLRRGHFCVRTMPRAATVHQDGSGLGS
jgi:hypothetical protein